MLKIDDNAKLYMTDDDLMCRCRYLIRGAEKVLDGLILKGEASSEYRTKRNFFIVKS